MVFVRLALFPSGTAEQYAALGRELEGAPQPPERLAFFAGPVAEGWQVVQVWTERHHLEAFNEEWLLPALRRLAGRPGAGFPEPPVVRDLETTEAWIADGGTSAPVRRDADPAG